MNMAELLVTVGLTNADHASVEANHTCILLIGDDDNDIVYKAKVRSEHVTFVNTGTAKYG